MKRFLLLFLAVAFLSGCSSANRTAVLSGKVYYFTSNSAQELTPIDASLETSDIEVAANELFQRLYSPPGKSLTSPLPHRIKLIDLSVVENECKILLSSAYRNLSVFEATALNGALVKTMCSLPGIERLSIACEDVSQVFDSKEFLTEIPRTYYESHTLNLYYTQNAYTGVVKETATISLSPDETLEKSVVLLLKNPSSVSSETPFPEGTKINDVYISEGICVVDVSKEFVSNAVHKKKQETAILFSIVNTLTELPKIDSVKFLIDGNAAYGYTYYNISNPLTNSDELFDINN